jgi:hypothetical protein
MNCKIKSILLFFILILVLTGCAQNPYKTVPGYLGIEVSHTNEITASTNDLNDLEKPFGEYNIEDKLKDSITIAPSEELDLYTSINKDIYLKILLKNPKKITITSVLINDVVYESKEFEADSDFNNIKIKVNVGNEQGINEYQLNEINYINGEKANSLKITENNLLKVGIKTNLPSIDVPIMKVSYTEITIESVIRDQKKLGKYFKLYSYDGDKLTEISELALDTSSTDIKGLDYDTTYQLAVVTEYDALDGNGNQLVILYKKTVKTRSVVEIETVVSGLNYLDFYISSYQNESSKITSISLYDDSNQLIENLTDLNLREFKNLQPNKNYNIIVQFEYQYGNGGTKASEHKLSTQTKDVPVIDELTITNISPITINQKIYANIKFNNPRNVLIYSVIIDGEEINLGTGAKTLASFEFIPKSDVGLYRLSISAIYIKINDEKVKCLVESSMYDEILIQNKDLNLIDINDENGEKKLLYGGDTNLILEFDNPSNQTITSIVFYSKIYFASQFEVIDNNHVKIIYRTNYYGYYPYENIYVQSISFLKEDGSTAEHYVSTTFNFCILQSLAIIPVSTVDELQQMEQGYSYKLMNDIDLFGIGWDPLAFAGIFDGDGHKISNYTSSEYRYCFFDGFTGILKNVDFLNFKINSSNTYQVTPLIYQANGYLKIINCSIDYTLTFNRDYIYDYFIGGFVAYNNGILDIFDSQAQGIINLNTKGTGSVYCGGLVGNSVSTTTFNNVQSSGEINIVSNQTVMVGGLLGSGPSIINNSTVNSSIEITNDGHSFIGGFVGISPNGFAQNCTMNGSINTIDNNYVTKYISGIGHSFSSISNCKNTGSINVSSDSYVYTAGISTNLDKIDISLCEMQGDITVFSRFQAMVGGIIYANEANIDNCKMLGDINVETTIPPFVAGIKVSEDSNDNEIKNCQMLGNTTIKSTNFIYYGGITNNGHANLINNKVYSDISISSNSSVYVGGMIACGNSNQFIENCSYIGKITINSEETAYVGGIVGYYQDSIVLNMNSSNLYVKADIIVQTNLRAYAGGLFGYIANGTLLTSNISNSKFEGSINVKSTGNTFAGGLIAHSGTKLKISNCEVVGNIKVDSKLSAYAGGFVASGTLSIKKSLMLANLEVVSNGIPYVGGFIGYNKYTSIMMIEDTVLLGDILVTLANNSSYFVGNLLGQNYSRALLTIYNCYIGQDVKTEVNKVNLLLTEAPIAKVELVNSQDFYKNNLHFKDSVWDFSKVDYENKIFPKLLLNL